MVRFSLEEYNLVRQHDGGDSGSLPEEHGCHCAMSTLINGSLSGLEERHSGRTSGEVVAGTYFPAHNLNNL